MVINIFDVLGYDHHHIFCEIMESFSFHKSHFQTWFVNFRGGENEIHDSVASLKTDEIDLDWNLFLSWGWCEQLDEKAKSSPLECVWMPMDCKKPNGGLLGHLSTRWEWRKIYAKISSDSTWILTWQKNQKNLMKKKMYSLKWIFNSPTGQVPRQTSSIFRFNAVLAVRAVCRHVVDEEIGCPSD